MQSRSNHHLVILDSISKLGVISSQSSRAPVIRKPVIQNLQDLNSLEHKIEEGRNLEAKKMRLNRWKVKR